MLLACVAISADPEPFEVAAKLLPDRIGSFKATGKVLGFDDDGNVFHGTANVSRNYQSPGGERFSVFLYKNASDSGAYARMNHGSLRIWFTDHPQEVKTVNVGTLGYIVPNAAFFYKGPVYAAINTSGRPVSSEKLLEFAGQFAATLEKGEGEIPALVKHLPHWEIGQIYPSYAVSLPGLKDDILNQPVLDAMNFEAGVEAVSARYGPSQLLIVEFNTPQIATDNSQRIVAKIQELRSQGQPAPTAYRRVGNYAVFVFDAPSEQAANQLIDQVKYQQVVQWLGQDPFSYEQATREFTETTLGVFVAVVKTSGLALAACLAVGGFFGALLFSFRRARQRAKEAYSDSDAMLRLNLDELTPENDPARLLGRGN